jgi:hypothetical protein
LVSSSIMQVAAHTEEDGIRDVACETGAVEHATPAKSNKIDIVSFTIHPPIKCFILSNLAPLANQITQLLIVHSKTGSRQSQNRYQPKIISRSGLTRSYCRCGSKKACGFCDRLGNILFILKVFLKPRQVVDHCCYLKIKDSEQACLDELHFPLNLFHPAKVLLMKDKESKEVLPP